MGALTILGFLGSLGTTELLMVFVVVLILFGPKQLPQVAKTIGKGLRDIRRAANQLKHEVGLDELDDIYPRSRPTVPPRRALDGSESDDPEGPPTSGRDVESDPEPVPVPDRDSAPDAEPAPAPLPDPDDDDDDDPQLTAFALEPPAAEAEPTPAKSKDDGEERP